VAIADTAAPSEIADLFDRYHLTIVRDFDTLGTALVKTPESTDLMQTIQHLNNSSLIRYAEPNLVMTTTGDTTAYCVSDSGCNFPSDPELTGATSGEDEEYTS